MIVYGFSADIFLKYTSHLVALSFPYSPSPMHPLMNYLTTIDKHQLTLYLIFIFSMKNQKFGIAKIHSNSIERETYSKKKKRERDRIIM